MVKYAIIVAGGSGTRMGSEIPKQFIEVKGLPILMHTLNAFYKFNNDIKLILVLPTKQMDHWRKLCDKYDFKIIHHLTTGGDNRFTSVKNGLALVDTPALIGIHDGVRPLVSKDTLKRCYQEADLRGNAIPVLDAYESVRLLEDGISKALDRSSIKLVQTPQVFKSDVLLRAYEQVFNPIFTDDASVLEAIGEKIHLVPGNRENIKITTPSDLIMVNAYMDALEESDK